MTNHLEEALVNAQGRSEFVIAVVVDIRGFSRFSTRQESPDIAMFIKRFYLRLMKDYFPSASFVKPTGDGLLMTFPYDESSLKNVAQEVLEACIRCLDDFPKLCEDDPMINFELPDAIGIGVARGTACCLYSGEETIDYSGHLLNLASRLNDLARPSGIVIDGSFLTSVIPESCRQRFKPQLVYVRSIAEEMPTPVFYLDKYVKIPASALRPFSGEEWNSIVQEFTYADLLKLSGGFLVNLPSRVKSPKKIKVTVETPRKGMKNLVTQYSFKDFKYVQEGVRMQIRLDLIKARELIKGAKLYRADKVKFKIEFIPEPIARSQTRSLAQAATHKA